MGIKVIQDIVPHLNSPASFPTLYQCPGHSKVLAQVSDPPHTMLVLTMLPPQSSFLPFFSGCSNPPLKLVISAGEFHFCLLFLYLLLSSSYLSRCLGKHCKAVVDLYISLDWAVWHLCPWHLKQYRSMFLKVGSTGPPTRLSESLGYSYHWYSWTVFASIGLRELEFLFF